MATFVRNDMTWSAIRISSERAEVEWIPTKVQETTIDNIYKPPPSRHSPSSLPAPAVYTGDFNSHHTDWGYSSSSTDGDFLVDLASTAEATLLYDPKEPHTFYSAQWNSTTNPDLAFAKWHNNQPFPVRHIPDMFPRSHHRPSLITIPSLVQPVQGRDASLLCFRKAN